MKTKFEAIQDTTISLYSRKMYTTLKLHVKVVFQYKYFRQVAGNILTLKRFSIKLTKIVVGNLLTFGQIA